MEFPGMARDLQSRSDTGSPFPEATQSSAGNTDFTSLISTLEQDTPPFPVSSIVAEFQRWMHSRGWQPFDFQKQVWHLMAEGHSGLLHCGTGTGKTLAAWPGALFREFSPAHRAQAGSSQGPGILWITPLRALAADTERALHEPLQQLACDIQVLRWTGDVSSSKRRRIKNKPPGALIITPESLSLLLSQPEWQKAWHTLHTVVVDEWHELLGSKRGVLLELSLARLRSLSQFPLAVWGLSATLGNIREAALVLGGWEAEKPRPLHVIEARPPKTITISSVLPQDEKRFPWAGHLGLQLLPRVLERLEKTRSALLFTNTRAQAEIWFHAITTARPDWAEKVALHHGSLDARQRQAAEEGLRQGHLRLVVATSSLDLGVDFSPVEVVFQVGSPKGIARLLQRAGRSGHQPGAPSEVVCVPANTFELLEITAARSLAQRGEIEPRTPLRNCLDVLCQHLLTVAAGGGFEEESLFAEVRSTHAFHGLSREMFAIALNFAATGGNSLRAYESFHRMEKISNRWVMTKPGLVQKHRMSIGTITSDPAVEVCLQNGKTLGTIEESAATRIPQGGRFLFAGRVLQAIGLRNGCLKARMAPSQTQGTVMTPRWMGGKMPLSTCLSSEVRRWLDTLAAASSQPQHADPKHPEHQELSRLKPVLEAQQKLSALPRTTEFLVERMHSREGTHLFFYPFEGWLAHQGLAALWSWRMSQGTPASLTWAVNDYGLELLSPDVRFGENLDCLLPALLEENGLEEDILRSLNATEMSRRKFREIARVAGLIFEGFPSARGRGHPPRQKMINASLLFEVFRRYEPEHFLLKQAYKEVLENELDGSRILSALRRLRTCRLVVKSLTRPSPFCFPLMIERLREQLSTESLQERTHRIQQQIEHSL